MKILATATIDDGFNGDTRRITLGFHAESGKITVIWGKNGEWCDSLYPPCASEEEAQWTIQNHPEKRYYKQMELKQ